MHSIAYRANAVFTLFGSVAATLAVLTSMTDLLHKSDPTVSLELGEVKRLVPYGGNRDQAGFDLTHACAPV